MPSADQYLRQLLAKYAVDEGKAKAVAELLFPVVQRWGGPSLVEGIYAGSIAKGTATSLSADADVFISLAMSTPGTLGEVYESLHREFTRLGLAARRQNVSIRVTYDGRSVDFVPGRRQAPQGYDHSLYRSKSSSWTKTNVKTHIDHVSSARRGEEIRLTKIWRDLHGIDFPSFYLELVVIDSLRGAPRGDIANNVWRVLGFLAEGIGTRRYVDPANANNVVSEDLDTAGKSAIQSAARTIMSLRDWRKVAW